MAQLRGCRGWRLRVCTRPCRPPRRSAIGTAGAARAGELYGTGAVGASWPLSCGGWDPATGYSFTDTFSGGFSGELGLGYDFGPVRTELTDSYEDSRPNGSSDLSGSYAYSGGQQGTQTLLVSAYWDINTNNRWTPYLGGGLGYGWQRQANSQDPFLSCSGYAIGGFAWQAKAGFRYGLSTHSDLFGELT